MKEVLELFVSHYQRKFLIEPLGFALRGLTIPSLPKLSELGSLGSPVGCRRLSYKFGYLFLLQGGHQRFEHRRLDQSSPAQL